MADFKLLNKGTGQKSTLLSIILYTDSNPYMVKCLSDNILWKSLDRRSGGQWIIFSVKPKQGSYVISGSSSLGYGMMRQIWEEPNDNLPLIEALGLRETKDLPIMLFFKMCEDFEMNENGFYIKIEGNNQDDVYKDLENIVNEVTKALEKSGDFFENVEFVIKKEKIHRIFKKAGAIISSINGLVPGFF